MLNLTPCALAVTFLLSSVAVQAAPPPPTGSTAEPQSNVSTQASPTPTLKVTTRIVVLDVVVTDKKGNLVQRDLTRDDF